MSADDRTTHFALLNESNYSEWVIRMEAHLIRQGLWDQVVFEADAGLSDEDATKARDGWIKKHTAKKMGEAHVEIILKVEDSQLSHVRDQDPKLVWEMLARVHIAQGFATWLALHR